MKMLQGDWKQLAYERDGMTERLDDELVPTLARGPCRSPLCERFMSVELDHVFLWVSVGGPEADRLAAMGLTEGQPNRHPGQGTACRRFFFANAYLELLWVDSPEEAQGDLVRPLRLWERSSGCGRGTCPFGVIFRPAQLSRPAPPFQIWEYRPPYLPRPLVLHVGANAQCVDEPLLFYSSICRRPDSFLAHEPHQLQHRIGFRELTALRLFSPHLRTPSAVMRAAEQTGAVAFHHGSEYLAEIGFDGERQRQYADLRPVLPLVICW
jgi:hypothetical protein